MKLWTFSITVLNGVGEYVLTFEYITANEVRNRGKPECKQFSEIPC